jgi:glutathione S-transferase
LAETLGKFQGPDTSTRQAVREWLYWDVDVLSPPIFGCYAVRLGQRNLLPISVEPEIAIYHRQRAEAAISVLDRHLAHGKYLCGAELTVADLFCYGDVAFAELCDFDLNCCVHVAGWAQKVTALVGFKAPFELLAMEDAELS